MHTYFFIVRDLLGEEWDRDFRRFQMRDVNGVIVMVGLVVVR